MFAVDETTSWVAARYQTVMAGLEDTGFLKRNSIMSTSDAGYPMGDVEIEPVAEDCVSSAEP